MENISPSIPSDPLTPIERDNCISMAKMMGVDFGLLTDSPAKEAAIHFVWRAFDYYTSKGADFGSGMIAALGDLFERMEMK